MRCADREDVVVIPTKTVPQGISAMLMMDESADVDELRENMLEAASGVHTALVTYAARDSEYDGFEIHAGEYLALMDGALLGSYTELDALLTRWAPARRTTPPPSSACITARTSPAAMPRAPVPSSPSASGRRDKRCKRRPARVLLHGLHRISVKIPGAGLRGFCFAANYPGGSGVF